MCPVSAKYEQKYIQSSATLNFDFGTLTPVLEGLSAKGMISFDYRQDDSQIYRREYYQYSFDDLSGTYVSKLLQQQLAEPDASWIVFQAAGVGTVPVELQPHV